MNNGNMNITGSSGCINGVKLQEIMQVGTEFQKKWPLVVFKGFSFKIINWVFRLDKKGAVISR